MRERCLQLVELCRRAVHLQPREVGNRERLREQRADVVQMSEKTFRIRVGFATENLIAVDGELIEKILSFARAVFSRRTPGTRP